MKYEKQIKQLEEYIFHLKTRIGNMKSSINGEYTREVDSKVNLPREIKECKEDIKQTNILIKVIKKLESNSIVDVPMTTRSGKEFTMEISTKAINEALENS